ncbi:MULTISPECIES: hypothetical protein [unclassified Providencia]|uniref:hypothetical protein n=1 Tax=unclassified Providencia TaxID=2633465 RepID=UPI001C5B2454|nr:hypothetical protein [Providencia sp. R33]ELR5152241.1 hypothetical protein [Providencia rettgeri]QXX80923.1 hypothetical protein J6836_11520 [Providencia sp. R33]
MPSISKSPSATAISSQPINIPITKKTIANQTKQISNQHAGLTKSILKSTGHKTQNSLENKDVKFSVVSKIKFFDQNESSLFLPPTKPSQKVSFAKTKQKTVKMEDIKQLKESVIAKLDDINQRTSVIEADQNSAQLTQITQLKVELNSITTSLNTYQALLNSSSYHHHKNKQATLTLLKSKVLITNHQLGFIEFQVKRPQPIQTKNQ